MSGNVLVRDVMTRNVKTVREDTSLREVIAFFGSLDVDSILVEQARRPVGIVTTRDALTRGFEHGMPASAITAGMVASSPVVTVDEEATVEEAVELMRRRHIKHLPVVKEGKIVGIVTDTDIMLAVPSMVGQMEEICRPRGKALTH